MSTKPILFNTEMVKAILEGRKTVTRRIIKRDLLLCCDFDTDGTICGCHDKDGDWYEIEDFAPYQIGDILYVRETWFYGDCSNCDGDIAEGVCSKRENGEEPIGCYSYKADQNLIWDDCKTHWKPSIHMPKEAARIWLKVTDVRVERLQDMKTVDFQKEGMQANSIPDWWNIIEQIFRKLWDSTVPKQDFDSYCWDANPWVWVIEFERIEKGDI